jgi:hypothetical protein
MMDLFAFYSILLFGGWFSGIHNSGRYLWDQVEKLGDLGVLIGSRFEFDESSSR